MKRIVIVFIITAISMVLVFAAAGWYAENSSMPRYCDDPVQNVELVREILNKEDPSGGERRRPYIIAAKLLFLVPQIDGETQDEYLLRIRDRISLSCGVAF